MMKIFIQPTHCCQFLIGSMEDHNCLQSFHLNPP